MLDTISREKKVFDLFPRRHTVFILSVSVKKEISAFRTSFEVLRVIINTSE